MSHRCCDSWYDFHSFKGKFRDIWSQWSKELSGQAAPSWERKKKNGGRRRLRAKCISPFSFPFPLLFSGGCCHHLSQPALPTTLADMSGQSACFWHELNMGKDGTTELSYSCKDHRAGQGTHPLQGLGGCIQASSRWGWLSQGQAASRAWCTLGGIYILSYLCSNFVPKTAHILTLQSTYFCNKQCLLVEKK